MHETQSVKIPQAFDYIEGDTNPIKGKLNDFQSLVQHIPDMKIELVLQSDVQISFKSFHNQ